MEKEEDLKKEVVELFNNLKEERKGIFDYTHGQFQDPNPQTFVQIFNEMFAKCNKLENLDPNKYDLTRLSHTKEKELKFVRDFKYEYDKLGKKSNKSLNELLGLMNAVIKQVKIDIPEILYS